MLDCSGKEKYYFSIGKIDWVGATVKGDVFGNQPDEEYTPRKESVVKNIT